MATKRASQQTGRKAATPAKRQSRPKIGNAHAAVVAQGAGSRTPSAEQGATFLEQVKRAEQQVKTVHVQKRVLFFRNPDNSIGSSEYVFPADVDAYELLTNGGAWPKTFSDEKMAALVKEGWHFAFV